MTGREKFAGFKQKLVDKNEAKYGKEIRKKYGQEVVDAANSKLLGLSEAEFNRVEELAQEITQSLVAAVGKEKPEGPEGLRIAELHRQWLGFYWKEYSKQAHARLAEMYVADERFTVYYDQHKVGAAQFLRDAIVAYAK